MPEFEDKSEESAFYEAYEFDSDRACAVVLIAMLENRVNAIFRLRFRNNTTIWNELFRPSGPLGSLGVKLRVLYMMGILRHGIYRDLITFSRIRNKFAHEPRVKSFDDQPICDWVRNLSTWETFKRNRDELRKTAPADLIKKVMADIYSNSLTSNREMFKLAVRIHMDYLRGLSQPPPSSP